MLNGEGIKKVIYLEERLNNRHRRLTKTENHRFGSSLCLKIFNFESLQVRELFVLLGMYQSFKLECVVFSRSWLFLGMPNGSKLSKSKRFWGARFETWVLRPEAWD